MKHSSKESRVFDMAIKRGVPPELAIKAARRGDGSLRHVLRTAAGTFTWPVTVGTSGKTWKMPAE